MSFLLLSNWKFFTKKKLFRNAHTTTMSDDGGNGNGQRFINITEDIIPDKIDYGKCALLKLRSCTPRGQIVVEKCQNAGNKFLLCGREREN